MHVHELLESVEENVRCTLHEVRPKEALEVPDSIFLVLQSFSIKQSLVDSSFTFKSVSQCGSSLLWFKFCDITPVVYGIFESKPATSTIIRWGNLGGHLLKGRKTLKLFQ